MNNKFSFLAVLGAVLLCSANVFALTCRNDYSSPSGCAKNADAAGDCDTLGYSTESVAGCSHYISCPFNTAYKRCTNVVCETGTYAAETDCKTTSGRACEKISTGCYKAVACATGTYETEAACKTATGKSCIKNSNGCYKAISVTTKCLVGEYETREECEAATGGLCRKSSTDGCWKQPELLTCFRYNLTTCPANAKCSECADDTTKLKFDGCNTNYYNSGSTSSPTCVSCASMQQNMQNLNTIAGNSYFRCTGTSCRKSSNCLYDRGSWTDGCVEMKRQTSDDPIIRDDGSVSAQIEACKESLQLTLDKINNFNTKCPNYKITNVFSPDAQCQSEVINNMLAQVNTNL